MIKWRGEFHLTLGKKYYRMKKILYLFALASALNLSCTQFDHNDEPAIESEGPIVLSAELQQRVAQDNDFALDLLKKTIQNSDESNVFISPLSVSIALGMAWNGAEGSTRTEMETALKMSGMSANNINEYYRIMLESLPGADLTTKLKIANSIWYRSGFNIKKPFLNMNSAYFDAEIRSLDFSKTWAVDTINNWCAQKTNNLIKEVIKVISPYSMMYVINAVYFKGKWSSPFDEKETYRTNFTDEQNKLSEVNMMYKRDTFLYYKDAYAQYLDMPYGNKAFSMTVILPANGKTTGEVLDHLTTEHLNTALRSLKMQKMDVHFPRFKTECNYELSMPLKSMGMIRAFNDSADFSKISDEDLYISSVIHKTYVEVTEEGTEAAAVTAIEFTTTSLPDYPIFLANKPFIFLIREKGTGVILFAGKMGAIAKY